jgi:hypothetical protein
MSIVHSTFNTVLTSTLLNREGESTCHDCKQDLIYSMLKQEFIKQQYFSLVLSEYTSPHHASPKFLSPHNIACPGSQ